MTIYTRHREQDNRFGISLIADDHRCNGTDGAHYDSNSLESYGVGLGSFRVTDDVEIPNFHARSAAGEIFNNPFHSWKQLLTCSTPDYWKWERIAACTGTTTKSSDGHTPRSGWGGFKTASGNYQSSHSDCRVLAGTQAWANVVSPEVLGGEFMRDIGKTWRMLRHPLQNFHETLWKIKNTNRFKKQGGFLWEFIQQEWLKYRYGMTPLLADIMGGFHAAIVPQYSDRLTARGSASAPEWVEDDSVVVAPDGHWTCTTERHVENQFWVRAGVLYVHRATVGGKFGMSAHNILPTLWEFIPGSFVGDWFINAGDFLAAVVPKAQVKVLAHWTTSKSRWFWESTQTSVVGPITGYTHSGGPGWAATKEEVTTLRVPYASRGLAFRSNDLTLSKPKNWLHFADALALAGQMLMHKPGKPFKPRPAGRKINPKEWTQTVYD